MKFLLIPAVLFAIIQYERSLAKLKKENKQLAYELDWSEKELKVARYQLEDLMEKLLHKKASKGRIKGAQRAYVPPAPIIPASIPPLELDEEEKETRERVKKAKKKIEARKVQFGEVIDWPV